MTDYPSVIALSELDGTNGFRIDGASAGDLSGFPVASAGDINDDGYADLILGAPNASPGGVPHAGSAFVVFGQASGFSSTIELSALNGTNGFRLDGAAFLDATGTGASAGDVNGDGIDDLIIGAVWADPGGRSDAGSSYVVFGSASDFSAAIDLSSLNGSNGFRLDGVTAGDGSGFPVAAAGDVNGDGVDDLIIGAFHADPNGQYSAGSSYVVFGKASGFAATMDLSALDGTNGFRLDGVSTRDDSGGSVASAGDVNGDGFADLIIGASGAGPSGRSYAGSSYVVFGKVSGFDATMDLSALDGTDGFRLDGAAATDRSGVSVASAGDVNADGYADLIVGAFHAGPGGRSYAGSSYVVFGKASGFTATIDLSALDGTDGFRLDGAAAGDVNGTSVSSAGDVNGDGFADLLVASPFADPGGQSKAGSSYVVFGRASGFAAVVELSDMDGDNGFRLDGVATNDYSGFSAASAGDVNGDGFADVLVGAARADPDGNSDAGSSYVVFGGEPGAAVTRNGTATANTIHGGELGDLLNSLGGDDHLLGHGGDDNLRAGAGDDRLEGGAGADKLAGGVGDDVLIGGAGADRLSGGTGNDTFVFQSLSDLSLQGTARDVIQDFAAGDVIDLSAIDADTSTLADDAFHLGATAGRAGDIRLFYDPTTDRTLVKLYVDADATPDGVFGMVGDHTGLTAGDFVL